MLLYLSALPLEQQLSRIALLKSLVINLVGVVDA